MLDSSPIIPDMLFTPISAYSTNSLKAGKACPSPIIRGELWGEDTRILKIGCILSCKIRERKFSKCTCFFYPHFKASKSRKNLICINIQIVKYLNIEHQLFEYSNIFVVENNNICIQISIIR
jgi:hypothetical protein